MLYSGRYEKRYSLRGHPFYVWKKTMPRIADQYLDTVLYLYPSATDAHLGESVGGTGFLISINSDEHEDLSFLYAVTNSHVIREGASPVIRLNTQEGDKDVLEFSQDDWVHHQDGDDLAVCPLLMVDTSLYRYRSIPPRMFFTHELAQEYGVGPGDDVFTVGRFINHEGRQRNTPSVRFGNISMMPFEPIRNSRGIMQESFLVETRSLGGYSGSPVFIEIDPMVGRPAIHGGDRLAEGAEGGTWLLGVDWGHLPIYEPVKEEDRRTNVPERWVVESNSGQMAVVPAWRLQELLNQEELVMQRKSIDNELTENIAESPVVLDMGRPEKTEGPNQADGQPEAFTENDFEDALDRVSRRESPPDQGS